MLINEPLFYKDSPHNLFERKIPKKCLKLFHLEKLLTAFLQESVII